MEEIQLTTILRRLCLFRKLIAARTEACAEEHHADIPFGQDTRFKIVTAFECFETCE